jgi:hypothetical protein
VPELPADVPVAAVRLRGDDPAVQAWASAVGLEGRPAVLVRPDGHILAVADDAEGLAGFSHAIMRQVATPQETATWT